MDNIFVYVIIAGLIVAFILASYFSKKAIIKRKLRKAELKSLEHFRDGEVGKVVGQVQLVDEGLRAPLSDRRCAYYHVLVEQKVSSGKSSHWKKLIEEEVADKLVLRSGANYAFVRRGNIESLIVKDRSYSSGFMNDAAEHLEWYLNSKGILSENMLGFNKTIRYREGVLEEGEEVAVLGQGVWKSAETLELPETYGQVLEICSSADLPVYLSDDPSTTVEIIRKKKEVRKKQSGFDPDTSRYFKKVTDDRYYRK